MAIKILWTKRALNNFQAIIQYLEVKFGEHATKAFAAKVHNFVDNLQDFPKLGSIQNAEKGIRGFVLVKQVNIYYKIYHDHIRILNLIDNRKNSKYK